MYRISLLITSVILSTLLVPPANAAERRTLTLTARVQAGEATTRLTGTTPAGLKTVTLQRLVNGRWIKVTRLRVVKRQYRTQVRAKTTAQRFRTVAGPLLSPVRTVPALPTPAAPPAPDPVAPAPADPVPVEPVPVDPPPAPKADACGSARFAADGTRRPCTFADDFNGSTLDPSKWVVQKTATSGFTTGGGRDCYVNDPDNVSVANGSARLTARVEATAFTCISPYGSFVTNRTAGALVTWDKFAQTYGRFEFRARFPAVNVQGIHSALWMFPQKPAYGTWPHSGEIDVAEWFSGAVDHVYPSVHYKGEDFTKSTGYDCVVSTANSAFHTYAVEWTPTVMKFYYDSKLCYSHSWTPDAPLTGAQPFDQPFVLVLTQAFGGAWNAMTSATPTTATMEVDWVRAWK